MSNFFSHIENLVMLAIILLQIGIFFHTWQRIRLLQGIFPDSTNYRKYLNGKASQIKTTNGHTNLIYQKIELTINDYLVNNAETAVDFETVKDITERHCDVEEDNIQTMLPIPLYLGLAGTMIGIIIGLFKIPDVSVVVGSSQTDDLLGNAITLLLGGVKTAMIASAAGLLFTIIHSGWLFKRAKADVENRKNDFYNYLQTSLLPDANNKLGDILNTLRHSLEAFNADFGKNVRLMNEAMGSNIQQTTIQAELMREIREMDVQKMAGANISVLQELNKGVAQMGQFNEYIGQLNTLNSHTATVVGRVNEVLQRSDHFEQFVKDIHKQMEDSTKVMAFFNRHFEDMDKFQQMLQNSVSNISVVWEKSLDELHFVTDEKIKAIKEYIIAQENSLNDLAGKNGIQFNDLKYLKEIYECLNLNSNASAETLSRIETQLQQFNEIISENIKTEVQNGEKRQERKKTNFLSWLKNIYIRNEKD